MVWETERTLLDSHLSNGLRAEMKTRSQREFESRVRSSRGLAHPAAPQDEGSGWRTRCARPGCEKTFITPTKQRKFCSDRCRRLVAEARERREVMLSGMLMYLCAAAKCNNVFLPEPRNPRHMYCSARCRKRAYREGSDLSSSFCAWCEHPLPLTKTKRRTYCDATCRKRAQRATTRNEN